MWSERKAAIVWGLITLGIGLVVAVVFNATQDHGYGSRSSFENGQMWGRALAPAIIVAAAIAYFVQKRRLQR